MELTVRLSHPVLVLPSACQLREQEACDRPPAYDTLASNISSSSLTALSLSSSSSSSYLPPSTGTILSAYVTLRVPSNLTLTTLTAKLVAYESIAYNNGGFEQSRPVEVSVSVPLPSHLGLQPRHTYGFKADLPCPVDMPPSVQLQDARLKYKVRVKARLQPTSFKACWLGSILRSKTLLAQTDLLVLQAAEIESDHFSHIRRLPIDGLASTCIAMVPSSCLIGDRVLLSLTLADHAAKEEIAKVELALVQDTHIRSRLRPLSRSTGQSKPRLLLELESRSRPSSFDVQELVKGKIRPPAFISSETEFQLPTQVEVQPSTQVGSNTMIHVSHHLQLRIYLSDSCSAAIGQTRSVTCSWPITLAPSESFLSHPANQLPVYTRADLDTEASQYQLEATSLSSVSHA